MLAEGETDERERERTAAECWQPHGQWTLTTTTTNSTKTMTTPETKQCVRF